MIQLVILMGMNPVLKFDGIIARKQVRGKRFKHQFCRPEKGSAASINADKARPQPAANHECPVEGYTRGQGPEFRPCVPFQPAGE